jgi:hypothetical protein
MWRDALHALLIVARRVLLAVAIIVGTALTPGAAWLGWSGGLRCLFQTCCPPPRVWHAKLRVKTARDAVVAFTIDQDRCPTGEPELLEGRYMSADVAKGPWGTRLFYHCEMKQAAVDIDDELWVVSAGPDRRFGTEDDISSRDL